jgi:hypothetical protein
VSAGHALDAPISWLNDWDAALAEARASRRVVLIDVWKDP